MAWVGLVFYALHFPLILTAIWSGRKLLTAAVAAAAAAVSGGLVEPLLSPRQNPQEVRNDWDLDGI